MTADEERVFAALADSTRRQLLTNLARNSHKTATQLAGEFHISRQGMSKHLELLANAGLVQSWTEGRERYYSLAPLPLRAVTSWIESIGQQWESRLDNLRSLVESDEDI